MKNKLSIITLLLIICACHRQKELVSDNSLTCLSRQSKLSFPEWQIKGEKWRETDNDIVIYTRYIKGSYCDMPIPEKMSVKIIKDTLLFDFARVYDPNCERTIGTAGIFIDFLVNKRRYPEYRNLKIKYKYDNPNW